MRRITLAMTCLLGLAAAGCNGPMERARRETSRLTDRSFTQREASSVDLDTSATRAAYARKATRKAPKLTQSRGL